jgi:hypothetical protein
VGNPSVGADHLLAAVREADMELTATFGAPGEHGWTGRRAVGDGGRGACGGRFV